ncbi:MAG: uracil-DNA glycosylase [Bacteroidetes bacterium]|jgi:DNA polymerase|nr:uracil-DNA glycosylase [Bacteroidota bacterium]
MNDSSSLLNEILIFLKNEREMYGDFTVNPPNNQKANTLQINNSPDTSKKVEQSIAVSDKKDYEITATDTSDNFENNSVTNSDAKILYEFLSACNTLEQLHKFCLKSDDLKTDLPNTNLVFGTGNPEADLMLIGEAPGEQEDKKGEPFVGRAGQLLTKILGAVNFKRSDVYITNILKHRPPGNRDPLPQERDRSLPYLYRQIDIISPKLILCLGKVAATTLLERDENLRDLRGKFHSFRGSLLMVTYHPAALLRNQQWKRPVWEDVQLLREKYDELGCSPK